MKLFEPRRDQVPEEEEETHQQKGSDTGENQRQGNGRISGFDPPFVSAAVPVEPFIAQIPFFSGALGRRFVPGAVRHPTIRCRSHRNVKRRRNIEPPRPWMA